MLRLATNLTPLQLSGLNLQTTPAPFAEADLILLEARGGHDELSQETADIITARVRAGAILLLTLAPENQLTSMRLGLALPSVTWQVAAHRASYAPTGPATIATADPAVFKASPAGRTLPHFFNIQPLSADERGQSTYAHYQRLTPLTGRPAAPGDELWTRPLPLRDIRTHLTAADNAQSPLLLSARYGAGRSMLFAGSFDALTSASLLPSILAFLAPQPIPALTPAPHPAPALDVAYGPHSVLFTLTSTAAIPVELVARAYTWQDAPLGFEHDLLHPVSLLPGRPVTIEMPLPQPSATGYHALTIRDAFILRAAILADGGATTLLSRQLLADFDPAVSLDLMADDINQWKYPFHAPGPSLQRSFGDRSAAQVGAYVYPPGVKISATLTVANGLRDLGPLATVIDSAPTAALDSANHAVSLSPAAALIDGAMVAHKRPLDSIAAQSFWQGRPNVDSILTFTFPHPVTLAAITLCGDWRLKPDTNPDSVAIQVDSRKLTSATGLAQQFAAHSGLAHVDFPPVTGTVFTLTFPPRTDPQTRKVPIQLTRIRFEGWTGKAPEPVTANLAFWLSDVFANTGRDRDAISSKITLAPGERKRLPMLTQIPSSSGEPAFYSLHADFNGQTRSIPVLSFQPEHHLLPYADLVAPDQPSEGFIVTAGFRACFPLGTGTAERQPGSWANPDDLIWAYSRRMKEIGHNARTEAGKLYLNDTDFRHYAQPWRPFPNGTLLYTDATPNLLAAYRKMPTYKESPTVHLSHSDRWDTGPHMDSLHSWQDMAEFDRHLRESGEPGLTGKTRQEVADEIHSRHEDAWQAYQLGLYLTNLRTVRDAFAADGKRLLITAQGVPTVAGAAGAELAQTIQAMSDDHSWGMAESSVSLTTGRQIGELAFNPVWKMSTLIQFGYTNGPLNNPEWHSPPGTFEPTRREYYDRAWRATIWPDGRYGSVYTAGYNENAGISYRMTEDDFRQWFKLEELHSLLSPEEPLGAGIVISTARFADPAHTRFTADGNLFNASPDGYALARLFQRLTDAGLSVPFGANASALPAWKGNAPLIVLTPEVFTSDELATLAALKARGIRLAAFTSATLAPETHSLFALVVPIAPLEILPHQAEALLTQLHTTLDLPLKLPPNTRGYGFRQQGVSFVVIEDWRTAGHLAEVRLRASSGKTKAEACSVNDHTSLKVRRDGIDWVIEAPIRPGDGQLVALREL